MSDHLLELRTIIDAGGSIHWGTTATTTVHHAGALLQLFLSELPVPLMTHDLNARMVAVGKLIASGYETDEAIIKSKTHFILAILPESHAALLRALLRALAGLVEKDATLAAVFSAALADKLASVKEAPEQLPHIQEFFTRVIGSVSVYLPKPIVGGLDDQPPAGHLQTVDSTSCLLPGENSSTDLSLESEAYKLFISYDLDKSNTIDRHEFGIFYTEFLHSIGRKAPSQRDIRKVWSEVDVNNNDAVSWEEFSRWWRSLLRDRSSSLSQSRSSSTSLTPE